MKPLILLMNKSQTATSEGNRLNKLLKEHKKTVLHLKMGYERIVLGLLKIYTFSMVSLCAISWTSSPFGVCPSPTSVQYNSGLKNRGRGPLCTME